MKRALLIVMVLLASACQQKRNDDRVAFIGINGSYPGVPPSGKEEHPFVETSEKPESTFGADVDTASYTYAHATIAAGGKPLKKDLRSEEFINYFSYSYPEPNGLAPIGLHFETAQAPWSKAHRLVKIGLKARRAEPQDVPPLHLTFLIDCSGSMEGEYRLGLVQKALKLLAAQMRASDRISLVTYNESIRIVLENESDVARIQAAIASLQAYGGTNGGKGIQTAYEIARKHFIKGGINRVILSTDGDFNIGIVSTDALKNYVEAQAREGVTLTVHGYGMGNFKDDRLEAISGIGNGNYAYIDTIAEADKVFRMQLLGTVMIVAKDVKLRVHFHPAVVKAYRLIGYENRIMENEDFENDAKDSGDMGSGHTVTALYEIVPHEKPPSKNLSAKLFDLSVRYKQPDSNVSELIESAALDPGKTLEQASEDFRFAAAAAAFAMILGESRYTGGFTLQDVVELAEGARGGDALGYRTEFVDLVKRAAAL